MPLNFVCLNCMKVGTRHTSNCELHTNWISDDCLALAIYRSWCYAFITSLRQRRFASVDKWPISTFSLLCPVVWCGKYCFVEHFRNHQYENLASTIDSVETLILRDSKFYSSEFCYKKRIFASFFSLFGKQNSFDYLVNCIVYSIHCILWTVWRALHQDTLFFIAEPKQILWFRSWAC